MQDRKLQGKAKHHSRIPLWPSGQQKSQLQMEEVQRMTNVHASSLLYLHRYLKPQKLAHQFIISIPPSPKTTPNKKSSIYQRNHMTKQPQMTHEEHTYKLEYLTNK